MEHRIEHVRALAAPRILSPQPAQMDSRSAATSSAGVTQAAHTGAFSQLWIA
jgi:hypothetical protein